MNGPFYIVGPTGVGKSDLAAEVAVEIGAEIIGADAFQVYRGFDLLTAKPRRATLVRAAHHLIGYVAPFEEYSVAQYERKAREIMSDILLRGKIPLVVGGSGLYVKALTHGLAATAASQSPLRGTLDLESLAALIDRLHALDPGAAQMVDLKNKRRVVRAIEVVESSGKPLAFSRAEWQQPTTARGVFLFRDREDLHRRIEERTRAMFAQGVMDEARTAGAVSSTFQKVIGLSDLRRTLAREISEAECFAQITLRTRQYAKRQATWFKREKHFEAINLSACASDAEAIRLVATKIRSAR